MINKIVSILLPLSIIISGCSPIVEGNQFLGEINTDEVNDNIIKGKSNKNDVKVFMGEPNSIDLDANGNEKWIYTFIQKDTTSTGFIPIVNQFVLPLEGYKKNLIFLFDNNGIVKNYVAHEGKCKNECDLF